MDYKLVRHKSGDVYAIAIDMRIVKAHGPLYYGDVEAMTPETIYALLSNQDAGDLEDDASWLEAEAAAGRVQNY